MQSLQTQAEIIAAAIAASATVETNTITIDPEKLLQLAPGENADAADETTTSSIEFSINPERVGPVLRRLVTPTRTRARIYDRDGCCCSIRSTLRCAATSCAPIGRRRQRRHCRWLRAAVERPAPIASRRRRSGAPTSNRVDQRQVYPEVAARLRGQTNPWCGSTPPARRSSRSRCRSSACAPSAARCCFRRKAATSTRSSPRSAGRSCASSWCWRR